MGERYFDQATQNGHDTRPGDLGHLQSLGVSALRYPVLWERVAPQGPEHADWMPGLVFGLACIDTESARVPEAPEVNLGPLLMEVRERPTAVAAMLRGLAAGRVITHPAALGQGWWRRDTRYVVPGASQVASTGNTMQSSPGDVLITPTYLPDLVDTCLNLVIDGECGVWHLTNTGAVSWIELARMAAAGAGLDPAGLRAQRVAECRYAAARPANSALHSSRANLLPTLHDALARMLAQRALGAGAVHTPAAK